MECVKWHTEEGTEEGTTDADPTDAGTTGAGIEVFSW